MTLTPILHQYDISPFSQKAQKMMALKGLAWHSIEMPLISPKPDVEALTGGYRGTPILQLGADIYIDNLMIARALDSEYMGGLMLDAKGPLSIAAVYTWGERFFVPLLHSALATYKDEWEPSFLSDRKKVFPNIDFHSLAVKDLDRQSQVRAFLGMLDRQIDVGSPFLGGNSPDSWDIHAWGMVWMIRTALPDLVPVVASLPEVDNWYKRVDSLGTGDREDVGFDEAWAALQSGLPRPLPETPSCEPLRNWLGKVVIVATGDADRGASLGTLLAVDYEHAVISVEPLPGVEAQVWFPRLGYHISLDA